MKLTDDEKSAIRAYIRRDPFWFEAVRAPSVSWREFYTYGIGDPPPTPAEIEHQRYLKRVAERRINRTATCRRTRAKAHGYRPEYV